MLKDLMVIPLQAQTKESVINEMTTKLKENGIIDDYDFFKNVFLQYNNKQYVK